MTRRLRDVVPLVLLVVATLCAVSFDAAAAGGAGGDGGDGGAAFDTASGGPHQGRKLRVGVAGDAPFIVNRGGDLTGVAVQIFQEVARDRHLDFTFVPIDEVPQGVAAVERGDLDLLVGDVSITAERAERMRFTQPYFQSGLGIATLRAELSLASRVRPFFSTAFWYGAAILLTILVIVGTLVWLVERKKNPDQFPVRPAAGIANGVWFALVTMTTVGYGDRAPVTGAGRVISGVWMIIALISASSLTAGIATALTLSQLSDGSVQSIGQLAQARVAVVSGTPAVSFVHTTRARAVPVDSLEQAIEKLAQGEVKAVVFDRPQLLFYAREHPELDLSVARGTYQPQGYGFAMPLDSDLQHTLNVGLLRMAESGAVQKITAAWFGAEPEITR